MYELAATGVLLLTTMIQWESHLQRMLGWGRKELGAKRLEAGVGELEKMPTEGGKKQSEMQIRLQ
jgi:hypothetical protein